MKKIAMIAALALVAGGLFAQQGPGRGAGMGPGMGADIEWKLGTVATSEYKKATGQVLSSTTLWAGAMTFKADGVEYQLFLPRVTELANLKSGDTVTIEGVFTTVKADTKVPATVRVYKITVGGKEVDLSAQMPGNGPGRDDNGGRGNGPKR